ncbi:hypothetical protein CEXT_177941 [Caerostris extrusa]|uniref:Uncharacterized protein n=1 Tax=Caerostris extrusa TaxID=172846 RepID=A0AAV4P6U5_CAEEX|nr:hypothetical protein CEXT_177941 [Caerostris extrusa]
MVWFGWLNRPGLLCGKGKPVVFKASHWPFSPLGKGNRFHLGWSPRRHGHLVHTLTSSVAVKEGNLWLSLQSPRRL